MLEYAFNQYRFQFTINAKSHRISRINYRSNLRHIFHLYGRLMLPILRQMRPLHPFQSILSPLVSFTKQFHHQSNMNAFLSPALSTSSFRQRSLPTINHIRPTRYFVATAAPPSPSPSQPSSSSSPQSIPTPNSQNSQSLSQTSSPSLSPRLRVRTLLRTPEPYLNSAVTISGWVRSVRSQKSFAFIDLNDGSSVQGLQIVVDADTEAWSSIPSLRTGVSITASGSLVASQGSGQMAELKALNIKVLGTTTDDYPLQKKRHSLEFLRSIAHLRPRTNSIAAVARVRSTLALATHSFFDQLGFVYLHSPIITASDCEGAGEMFRVTTAIPLDGDVTKVPILKTEDDDSSGDDDSSQVDFSKDFFGKPAYLTVSGQLAAETYATALCDVYTFGPTFRAENSNTKRHLAEFWMIEPEMAFAGLQEDMQVAEAYIKHVVTTALEKCPEEINLFSRFVQKGLKEVLENVVTEPFARISYTEAIDILLKANKPNKKGKKRFEYEVNWGLDLQSEHERYLAEEYFKKPVFVYNYPAQIKAFYMRDNDEDDGKTVQAMDLLVPRIGELIGGSAREERIDILERKLEQNDLEKEAYWWYLDLRKYGSVPHAGFGLGFERLVQFVTGMENIRDVIPFPRYPGNAEF